MYIQSAGKWSEDLIELFIKERVEKIPLVLSKASGCHKVKRRLKLSFIIIRVIISLVGVELHL